MEKLELNLQVKPVSTNELYASNGYGITLSKKNREFKKEVRLKLSPHLKQIAEFTKNFDSTKNVIKANYVFYVPKEKLFTKKGTVSKKSIDVDNFVKSLTDSVFKIMGELNSDCDDSQIMEMNLKKTMSHDDKYYVRIELFLISLLFLEN